MPGTTILQAVLGSHGQGFATPESDRDFGQVYVRPGREILHWSYRRDDDSIQLHEPEDEWGHELGKFVKLALNCNLTILELLFVPQRWVTVETWEGRLLRENGTAFLSRQKFHDATRGYATQQLRRAESELRTDKARRHALRLIATGIHAHTHGGIVTELPQAKRDEILAASTAPDAEFTKVYGEWLARLDMELSMSNLPREADITTVTEIYERIRRNHP